MAEEAFRYSNRKSDRAVTPAILGLSRKWVWRWAEDRTPEASRSDLPRCRLAARRIRPFAAELACIACRSFWKSSGDRVRYRFDLGRDNPDSFDIDLYQVDSLHDLAVQFVDEGLFGEIPKAIENYLDYDAIARDLGMDYGAITIGGTRYAYRAI